MTKFNEQFQKDIINRRLAYLLKAKINLEASCPNLIIPDKKTVVAIVVKSTEEELNYSLSCLMETSYQGYKKVLAIPQNVTSQALQLIDPKEIKLIDHWGSPLMYVED